MVADSPRCPKAVRMFRGSSELIEEEPGHFVRCLLFGDQLEKYKSAQPLNTV